MTCSGLKIQRINLATGGGVVSDNVEFGIKCFLTAFANKLFKFITFWNVGDPV